MSEASCVMGLDAVEVALALEESFIAGARAPTPPSSKLGEAGVEAADAGPGADPVVVGSVDGVGVTLPEDALPVPPVIPPGELEPLPSAGAPADEEDGGVEPAVTVPDELEPLPAAGVPADEEDEGGGLVATGIGLSEEPSSPEADPCVEEEPSLSLGEEGERASLCSPSTCLLADPESPPSSEAPPDDGGGVVGADVVSEESSPLDDEGRVEGEAPFGAGDEDADVPSPSVELPLVFALSPEESSDPLSVDESRFGLRI